MEGKANVNISNINDDEKETVTLTYVVKDCGNLDNAQNIKNKFDAIAETEGADVHKNALEVARQEN